MLTVSIAGIEYPLAANLRVAYQVQNKNNHESYTKIFSDIGDMTLEKQIEILYVAFCVANPQATSTVSWAVFLNEYLDNSTAKEIMEQLKEVISGILGTDVDETADGATTSQGNK